MLTVRVYDPERDPPHWRQIIRPGQFVAFTTDLDSGASCAADGSLFASVEEGTCTIFDSLPEASAFCQARVEAVTRLRFDVFDHAGRSQSPLLVVVHPSRAEALEDNRRGILRSYWLVGALVVAGPVLLWIDWGLNEGLLIWPTAVGINCFLAAGRLLQLNLAYASSERSRRERVAAHVRDREG